MHRWDSGYREVNRGILRGGVYLGESNYKTIERVP